MSLTRRSFFRYCTLSAAVLGLDALKLRLLDEALANPAAPSVIWLNGSSCTGCSVSFLNRISDVPGQPTDVVDVVGNAINLVFHPTIMSAAGETAISALKQAYNKGGYVLVLEGAVPTAFDGHACVVWKYAGQDVTYQQAVQELTARALVTICVGTCASFGGIPASGSNPTGAMGVHQFTGRPTINISGCPANPDWVVWAVVQLLLGNPIPLDADGRPVALYSTNYDGSPDVPVIHNKCPRNPNFTGTPLALNFGEDGHCLQNLGCRGPFTKARCKAAWNGIGGVYPPGAHPGHWCVGVEKTFPGSDPFHEPYTL